MNKIEPPAAIEIDSRMTRIERIFTDFHPVFASRFESLDYQVFAGEAISEYVDQILLSASSVFLFQLSSLNVDQKRLRRLG